MISIKKRGEQLLLIYQPEFSNPRWVSERLERYDEVSIRIFTFTGPDLVEVSPDEVEEPTYTFVLGEADGEYYRAKCDVLEINHDLWLFKDMPISQKTFIAERNISVFNAIGHLIDRPIVVGGNAAGAIPLLVELSITMLMIKPWLRRAQ